MHKNSDSRIEKFLLGSILGLRWGNTKAWSFGVFFLSKEYAKDRVSTLEGGRFQEGFTMRLFEKWRNSYTSTWSSSTVPF